MAGDWDWEEGEIAGVQRGQIGVAMGSGSGHMPIYNVGKVKAAGTGREDPGVGIEEGIAVNKQFTLWGSDIPESKTLAHTPGEFISMRELGRYLLPFVVQVILFWRTFSC